MMLNFKSFLIEKKHTEDFGNLDNDSKGKLHEILVGHHLLGGRHMTKHSDEEGLSPEEKHDEIVSKIPGGVDSEAYRNHYERARKAAEDIKKQLGITNENPITNVQWTSKAGDIKRATGINSTQQEDPSDIVVTDNNGKHHGISLKVSDDNKPITLANPGLSSSYGGERLQAEHKENIKKSYPELAAETNKDRRKEILRNNPVMRADIRSRNKKLLDNISQNMMNQLNKMTPAQRAEHIRNYVLAARSTPMQQQGHNHIRHFTQGGTNPSFVTNNPGQDYEKILTDPENITMRNIGTGVEFSHNHIPFALHSFKFQSQSDPLGSVQGNGREVNLKKPRSVKPQPQSTPSSKPVRGKVSINTEKLTPQEPAPQPATPPVMPVKRSGNVIAGKRI